MSQSITKVREEDWPQIFELEREEYANKAYPPEIVRMFPILYKECCWVYKNPALAGYCWGACTSDENPAAWILALVVRKQFRGQGIGGQLLQEALSGFKKRGIETFYLTVAPQNASAINLYKRSGFVVKRIAKDFYGPGEDRIVMKFAL